ncbi:regulator of (H+)-ATPase in vacuolar membrane [Elasticomyces elasticus]|nr:regulator of (H+)-ATPase in vacuolar membrane [Elasticomyces elasticus]
MQSILPGAPLPTLQAVTTGSWEGQQIIVYISGGGLVILNGPDSLVQSIDPPDAPTERLVAVALDGSTGKIAAASRKSVYVYGLYEEVKGTLRWLPQQVLRLPEPSSAIPTLSWGSNEELLVGSTSLSLFSTHLPSASGTPVSSSSPLDKHSLPTWTIPLSSPPAYAVFSPSASLVATISGRDRLVKIWRRLSFQSAEFDYVYLPHPMTVTHLEWKQGDDGDEEVLYTICADGRMRVWMTGDAHSIEMLRLAAEIDLEDAVQPRQLPANGSRGEDAQVRQARYAFVISSATFSAAAKQALETRGKEKNGPNKHALEHLNEVMSRSPDVVVVLDGHGHMSAWGLENISCKRRSATPSIASRSVTPSIGSRPSITPPPVPVEPFHIAHAEGLNVGFISATEMAEKNARFVNFCGAGDGTFNLVTHHFDGRITWCSAGIEHFLDPSPRKDRLTTLTTWTGHSNVIGKVVCSSGSTAVLSISETRRGSECILWRVEGATLARKCRLDIPQSEHEDEDGHILDAVVLNEGDLVVLLHPTTVSLWETQGLRARQIARCPHNSGGKPSQLIALPGPDPTVCYLASSGCGAKGMVWEVQLSSKRNARKENKLVVNGNTEGVSSPIRDFCSFDPLMSDIASRETSDLRLFRADSAGNVALSYASSKVLNTRTVRINLETNSMDIRSTRSIEAGVNGPALVSRMHHIAAMVDENRTNLTMWDVHPDAGRLEFEESFEEPIISLEVMLTPSNPGYGIVAVGFAHRVRIYTQLRHDANNSPSLPSWAAIKEVSIASESPHPIVDLAWLGNGGLVGAAGNQMFVVDNRISLDDSLMAGLSVASAVRDQNSTSTSNLAIFDVVNVLNAPLPVWHPQFLRQCILAGRLSQVQQVLLMLYETLKFWTEGDEMDQLLELEAEDFIDANALDKSSSHVNGISNDRPNTVTDEVAKSLDTLLTEKSLPGLSGSEQETLAKLVGCICAVERYRHSTDLFGFRFLLFWRLRILHTQSANTNNPAPAPWREINWAYHSTSQEILLDQFSQHYPRILWPQARSTGLFCWLSSHDALCQQFEVLARNHYTSTPEKNPIDCSLFYLALRKKQILVGLWRMATWSREQSATMRLLKNDFSDERWKTAAKKNAYALMGRRRFEYAAAFFLLGDDLASAVNILDRQLRDTQLAIAVARVYGGDDSPVLRRFLRENMLPDAVREGDRWKAAWVYSLMGERALAVRTLVKPLRTLLDKSSSPSLALPEPKQNSDDPALVDLYKHLREGSKGDSAIGVEDESRFVKRNTRVLRRMGCNLLALELVRNWTFLAPSPLTRAGGDVEGVIEQVEEELVDPPLTDSRLQLSETRTEAVPSMLDDWATEDASSLPEPTKIGAKKPPGIPNAWGIEDNTTTSAPEREAPNNATDTGDKKAIPARPAQRGQLDEKKPQKAFKEPDPNSLLDAFGF